MAWAEEGTVTALHDFCSDIMHIFFYLYVYQQIFLKKIIRVNKLLYRHMEFFVAIKMQVEKDYLII